MRHLDAVPWRRCMCVGSEGFEGGIRRSGGGATIRLGSRGEELERGGGNCFRDGESARPRRRHCSCRRKDGDVWTRDMGEDWEVPCSGKPAAGRGHKRTEAEPKGCDVKRGKIGNTYTA
jgi:hypothetical protein